MSAEARRELRERNPEFPPIMFMTTEEKELFFEEKSESFLKLLESTELPPAKKSKKIVKFLGKVEHIYDPNTEIVEQL